MLPSIGLWYTFKQCFNCLNYEIRWQPNIYQWETDSIKFSLHLTVLGLTYFCTKCSVSVDFDNLSVCVSREHIRSPFYDKVRFKSIPGVGLTSHSTAASALLKDLPSAEAKKSDLFCHFLGPNGEKVQALWHFFQKRQS